MTGLLCDINLGVGGGGGVGVGLGGSGEGGLGIGGGGEGLGGLGPGGSGLLISGNVLSLVSTVYLCKITCFFAKQFCCLSFQNAQQRSELS